MTNLFPGRAPDLIYEQLPSYRVDEWKAGRIALLETPRGWYVWFVVGGMA